MTQHPIGGRVFRVAFACALVGAMGVTAYRFAMPDPLAAHGPGPGPEEWEQAPYVLARGELVRLVPPPQLRRLPPPQAVVRRESSERVWTDDVRRSSLRSLLERWGNLDELESEFSGDVAGLRVDGDWLVRNGEPRTERIHAIVSIVGRALGRDLRVERRWERREVIVVSGRVVKRDPLKPHVVEELMGVTTSSMAPLWERVGSDCWTGPNLSPQIIPGFLRHVQKLAGCVVIDEASYSFSDSIPLPWIEDVSRPLAIQLLSQMSDETSLIWEKTQREIAIYRIYEHQASERVEPR